MAFRSLGFAPVSLVGGWTHWVHIDHNEPVAEMCKVGYFNQTIALVNTGDLITLVGSDTVKQMYIFINNGEVILMELSK